MNKKIYDPIHGYMDIDNISIKIIDNKYFKRLKNIKQLGTCYEVFPGASHNRFEHSIGVYYLSDKMINNLDSKYFTNHQKKLINIAALGHDLGHGPFSHVFDNEILKDSKSVYKHHEMRSQMILEHILKNTTFIDFKLSGYDIDFIKDLIEPSNEHSNYLYQIVSNNINGIDVDKMDYIQRDIYNIGLKYSYDYDRILDDSKIINNNICYSEKIKNQILDMFYTRYRLHKEVYNHPVVKSIEYMVRDILLDIDTHINFKNDIDNINFCKYDDNILKKVYDIKELSKGKKILNKIYNRDIYKYIGEVKYEENILKDFISDININSNDIIIQDMTLSFNNSEENPINNIRFYNKNNINKDYYMSQNNITKIIPQKYSERTLRLFSKKNEINQKLLTKFNEFFIK